MEEWFGQRWWTARFWLLVVTTLLVLAPLICLKRVGTFNHSAFYFLLLNLASNSKWLNIVVIDFDDDDARFVEIHISIVSWFGGCVRGDHSWSGDS